MVGYRVVSVATKRVAAAQPLGSEPAAADDPEPGNRFGHVVGAAGHVSAAAGKQRREHYLVYADQCERGSKTVLVSKQCSDIAGVGRRIWHGAGGGDSR